MGEAINLVNNFKVEKVIFNCGTYNDLKKELNKKIINKKLLTFFSKFYILKIEGVEEAGK